MLDGESTKVFIYSLPDHLPEIVHVDFLGFSVTIFVTFYQLSHSLKEILLECFEGVGFNVAVFHEMPR